MLSIARFDHRLSGSGMPSFASGERANAGHCSPPVQPKRHTVRAGAPSGNAGTLSSGSGWNAPLQARPRSASEPAMLSSVDEAGVFTVSQPARLRKDVEILRAAVEFAYIDRDSGCGCRPRPLE